MLHPVLPDVTTILSSETGLIIYFLVIRPLKSKIIIAKEHV
jgi:hypothetical protein